ncbi:methylated-DNA--[protein]-cysteine S-methyltransferase [Hymenobacter endophyticus]|uniref:Methylated-DNA--protein-cysteine methyltransferase n=1 Tax=Hymenobacter endophyticus TaxID=3076335 RepID=A0ABU3TEL4_9BACT|nr:methylated-DNA--[protein]-cysteine S-methyltransferase [Hymenobacter endophyticus]MDU0369821.1 methylated-DNA--[protein]-cysteine S-methyltransferase [Hymenobacter endophyticus]
MTDARAILATPLGPLELQGTEAGLRAARFLHPLVGTPSTLAETPTQQVPECLRETRAQLRAYFGRELQHFTVATDVAAGTEFQQLVWATLPAVGYGRTASYLEVARQLGNPGAVRAVGAANGQNPLTIIWPCHRIIGAAGQLTGYAGGLARKRWLLEFERPSLQTSLF